MHATTALNINNTTETRVFFVWLVLLGVSLSLSLAVANILCALAFIYFLIKHPDLIKTQLNQRYIKYILIIALVFQCLELIHDGLFIAKASKVFLTFTITLMLGHCLRQFNLTWLPYLLLGLILGLAIGTPLNQHMHPEYPLWATYSMAYANQAAGFVITVGLLSLATKKWWVVAPILISMAYYLYMVGERAAIPALALSLIVLLIILRKYTLLLAIAAITAVTVWSYSHDSIKSQYSQNVRFDIWQHGILIAKQDLFLGRGEHHELNQAELNLYKTYASPNGKRYLDGAFPKHPDPSYNVSYHNQSIQFLVEYGIIGSLIFLIFLMTPILQAWRCSSLTHEQTTFIMLWTAFITHCCFETAFDSHSAIILGLLAGLMNTFHYHDTSSLSS